MSAFHTTHRLISALMVTLLAGIASVLLVHADEPATPEARSAGAPVEQPAVVTQTLYLPVVMKLAVFIPFANGDFETGNTSWTVYSNHGRVVIRNGNLPGTVTPHSGTYLAWLGGAYNETTYLQQNVAVNGSMHYLTYSHWIASSDICGYDQAAVRVNGLSVDSYDLCDAADTNGWVKHVVNLSAYVGQSVTIQIRVTTDSTYNSNLFIDDVGFQATPALQEPSTPAGALDSAETSALDEVGTQTTP